LYIEEWKYGRIYAIIHIGMKQIEFKTMTDDKDNDLFDGFLKTLDEKQADKIVERLIQIENHGLQTAIKMKWVKKIDKNLYEIRVKFSSNIQRVFYFQKENNQYVITHGFTKKTQKTPPKEITRAKRLRDQYLRRR
tara:strand:+ start:83 stop:490 length:408 start_codon:yes stop_codon:yes gene_type:complete